MTERKEWLVGFQLDLLRYCRSIVGGGMHGWEAEDVAQETVVKLLNRLEVDPDFSPSKPYVLRTARNLWIDRLRKRQEATFSEMPESSGKTDTYETREMLDVLIRRLPPRSFVILLLCDVFGFTAKEAANRIDSAETAVQVALSRARSRLRQLASRESGRDASTELAPVSAPLARLLDEVTEAFRQQDPNRIYRAYLRLYESGSTLAGLRMTSDGMLSFTFRDPDGNLLMVTG